MTNRKGNVNIQYSLKTDHPRHLEAKFFAISFFFFFKTKLSNIFFYSTDHWTYKQLQYMPVIREILQRSSKHKTEVPFLLLLRLTEVFNTIKNAKLNTTRSH